MPASRRPRSYESPLRAEQMDRTREKVIEAGIDLVAEAGGEELTVRRVATRAGVSVPTAYRYFPDRDALFVGMAAWINARIGGPNVPTGADGAPAWARHIYASFESNDRLMRAQLSTPAGRALRTRNQKARVPQLVEMAKQSFPSTTAVTQRRLAAVFQILVSVPSWVSLHDNWGMSGAEAGEIVAWAIQTLLGEIRRHPAALDFTLPGAPPAAAEVPAVPRTRERGPHAKPGRAPKIRRVH